MKATADLMEAVETLGKRQSWETRDHQRKNN